MSHIRSKNTKPEVKLRKELFNLGYRYRINVNNLPGKPDIVLPKFRTCIFVNGCFWHGHNGCVKFVLPKTNFAFWKSKIDNNRERDLKDYTFLESQGWRVIVVWECQLTKATISETLGNLKKTMNDNRQSWLDDIADRRRRREEWYEEMKNRKSREVELKATYSIIRR